MNILEYCSKVTLILSESNFYNILRLGSSEGYSYQVLVDITADMIESAFLSAVPPEEAAVNIHDVITENILRVLSTKNEIRH